MEASLGSVLRGLLYYTWTYPDRSQFLTLGGTKRNQLAKSIAQYPVELHHAS